MHKLDFHITSVISQRLKQLDELRDSIIDILPIDAQNIKMWPVLSKGKLTLFTDDIMLATQVRYQQKNICTHLNSAYKLNIRAVNTKLIPPTIASQPVKDQSPPLDKSTSNTLSIIANEIEDSELKQILKNIGN